MPTIEEIENQMGMPVAIMEEGKEGAWKLSERERMILKYCKKPRSAEDIMSKLGISNQTRNKKRYIGSLIERGFLAMTLPDTPRSVNQKYVTVKKA